MGIGPLIGYSISCSWALSWVVNIIKADVVNRTIIIVAVSLFLLIDICIFVSPFFIFFIFM